MGSLQFRFEEACVETAATVTTGAVVLGDSTSISVPLPAHTSGDFLFVAIATDGSPTITPPAGWSAAASPVAANGVTVGWYSKVAASSSETTPVFGLDVAEDFVAWPVVSDTPAIADGGVASGSTAPTTTAGNDNTTGVVFSAADSAGTFTWSAEITESFDEISTDTGGRIYASGGVYTSPVSAGSVSGAVATATLNTPVTSVLLFDPICGGGGGPTEPPVGATVARYNFGDGGAVQPTGYVDGSIDYVASSYGFVGATADLPQCFTRSTASDPLGTVCRVDAYYDTGLTAWVDTGDVIQFRTDEIDDGSYSVTVVCGDSALFGSGPTAFVQVSGDGGSSWTTLLDHVPQTTNVEGTATVTVSGGNGLLFRFGEESGTPAADRTALNAIRVLQA